VWNPAIIRALVWGCKETRREGARELMTGEAMRYAWKFPL
jgi:hypothetical protein